MGHAEKTTHRSPVADVVRRRAGTDGAPASRPPGLAGFTVPGMSALQRIQRCAGNRATEQVLTGEGDGRLHRCGPVPCMCSPEERLAKEGLAMARYDGLSVSHPAEPGERDADEVADRVMRMGDHASPVQIPPVRDGSVHRCAEDVADVDAGGAVRASEAEQDTRLASGIAQEMRLGGQALDGGVRRFMEARFGSDFGPVRVHTDAVAGRLARQADAHAFTVGRHVFFAPGQYRSENHAGRRLLAHELTHVMQQSPAGLAMPTTLHRQTRSGSQPPTAPAPVPAEKFSGTLEAAYRRAGDHRRAAAIRMCREAGGAACSIVLTQTELKNLYRLAQQSGGDEGKIRAGLAGAAPVALASLQLLSAPPGLPPGVPIGPVPPAGVPGFPTWAPPPPVATPPTLPPAGVAVAATEATGAGVSAGAMAAATAAAVAVLVIACVVVAVEAWQLSRFQHELEAKGYIVLDDALGRCISGCHGSPQPIRSFPDLDLPPLRPIPEFPFPGRPVPMSDIEIGGRRRPRTPDDDWGDPEGQRKKEKPRDRPLDRGPDTDIDPRADKRRRSRRCQELFGYAPCVDERTREDVAQSFANSRGQWQSSSAITCYERGGSGSFDDCLGGPGENWHCEMPDSSFVVSLTGCLCCDQDGTVGKDWHPHESSGPGGSSRGVRRHGGPRR
jgi:hypothetical protein